MIAIGIIATAVAIIWGAFLLRRTGLLGGCLAILFVGSVFGYPFFHKDIGGIPITADRLLLVVLGGLFVVAWRLGLLAPRRLDRTDLTMLAFAAVLVVSAATHGATAKTAAMLMVFYLMPLTVYWILRSTPLSNRAIWGLLWVLATFGFYLAVTSVFEQQRITALVFPRYIMSPAFEMFLGRGRGPFLNPAGDGLYMIAGLAAWLLLWPRASRLGKLLLLLTSIVFAAGVACTLTRAVWGAMVVALIIVGACTLPRRWSIVFALTFTTAIGGIAALKWHDLSAFKRDRDVTVSEMAESARLRPILAVIAWHMFLDRPLAGCGYGQYSNESIYYLADRSTSLPLEKARDYSQHNTLLSLLTETGVLGTGLFLLMLACWLRIGWQLYASAGVADLAQRQLGILILATLAVYLVIGMFHDMTVVRLANMLVYFLAGVGRSAAGGRVAVRSTDLHLATGSLRDLNALREQAASAI